ncbi:MAG: hypothetical protein IPM54_16265 [Polyangiaceae bacterium]|nr:hypothetical protein [Polyangiaceae bacterium]
MNRIVRIIRSSVVPLLAFRLTAFGLLGCVHFDDADTTAIANDGAAEHAPR